jgi:PPOX class probable F420-dependent enzyme
MDENAVKEFLASKMNLQLATIDDGGDPVIQPVWFFYDNNADKIYINTSRESQKVRNIARKSTVYFSIDEDTSPYRCVKGKAKAHVSDDSNRNLTMVESMVMKYLGDLDHPFSRQMLDQIKRGDSVVIELTPAYYSAWDFGQD